MAHPSARGAVAALAGSALAIVGFVVELAVPVTQDGLVVDVPLQLALLGASGLGAALLAFAAWEMLVRAAVARGQRAGGWMCATGFVLHAANAVVAAGSVARHARLPDIFLLFALGFLLLLVGQVLAGIGLVRRGRRAAGIALLAASAGILVALIDAPGVHDLGLLVLYVGWAASGAAARASTVR